MLWTARSAGTGAVYTPAFIQIPSCGPPTGGVIVYCTGPSTWSCSSAPGWSMPSPGQPCVSHARTPGTPVVFGTRFGGRCTVV